MTVSVQNEVSNFFDNSFNIKDLNKKGNYLVLDKSGMVRITHSSKEKSNFSEMQAVLQTKFDQISNAIHDGASIDPKLLENCKQLEEFYNRKALATNTKINSISQFFKDMIAWLRSNKFLREHFSALSPKRFEKREIIAPHSWNNLEREAKLNNWKVKTSTMLQEDYQDRKLYDNLYKQLVEVHQMKESKQYALEDIEELSSRLTEKLLQVGIAQAIAMLNVAKNKGLKDRFLDLISCSYKIGNILAISEKQDWQKAITKDSIAHQQFLSFLDNLNDFAPKYANFAKEKFSEDLNNAHEIVLQLRDICVSGLHSPEIHNF